MAVGPATGADTNKKQESWRSGYIRSLGQAPSLNQPGTCTVCAVCVVLYCDVEVFPGLPFAPPLFSFPLPSSVSVSSVDHLLHLTLPRRADGRRSAFNLLVHLVHSDLLCGPLFFRPAPSFPTNLLPSSSATSYDET